MPGHATSTSCRLCRDIPVAQGPGISYCTPLALCECGGQWFLISNSRLILSLINHDLCECLHKQPMKDARRLILSWGYVQDERYIAIEHMEVRRDCVSFAHGVIRCAVQN